MTEPVPADDRVLALVVAATGLTTIADDGTFTIVRGGETPSSGTEVVVGRITSAGAGAPTVTLSAYRERAGRQPGCFTSTMDFAGTATGPLR